MLRKTRSLLLSGLLCFALSSAEAIPQQKAPPGEPFIFSSGNDPITLNPLISLSQLDAQIQTAFAEGLVIYDPQTLEPLPGAAESWTVSKEKTRYLFTLRKGLTFSNGDPLTAANFRETWLYLASLGINRAPFASLLDVIKGMRRYRLGKASASEVGVFVKSETELVIELQDPAPFFIKILAHHSLVPVHSSRLSTKEWDSLSPVNGPFKISKVTDEFVLFVKNPLYWDHDNVALPAIKVLLNQSLDELTEAFNLSRVDWAASGFDLTKLKNRRALNVKPLFGTSYFFFSNRQIPWNNPDVRRAMALLLPWERLREGSSFLFPFKGTLVPPIPHYPQAEGIERQQISAGLDLLKKAGFPKGEGLPEISIVTVEGVEDPLPLAIKETWEGLLKVRVTLLAVSSEKLVSSPQSIRFTLGQASWIGDYADPLTFLQMWQSQSSLNDARFSSDEFDKLLETSMGKPLTERYKLLSQAESILLRSGQVLPISHATSLDLIDLGRVKGWYYNVLDIHPFKSLYFSSSRKGETGNT